MAEREERPEPSEAVETVSAVGGALGGTGLTFLAGPFVGSAGGELIARVLLRVGSEIERRFLAPRQERRIGEAFAAATDAIANGLEAGREVRTDGFFDPPDPEHESPAEEIFEGVLRTAADEWEQRKVPYIGRIFASLSFDASVGPSDASYLLKLAERLTYQQVVLLAFWDAARDPTRPYQNEVISAGFRQAEGRSRPKATILAEINDLASRGLLGVIPDGESVASEDATIAGLEAFGTWGGKVDLTAIGLTHMGRTLHRLMDLDEVPDRDLEQIASALHGPI